MKQEPQEKRFEILTQHDVHIFRELTGFIFKRSGVKAKPVITTRRKVDFQDISFATKLGTSYKLAHIIGAREAEIFYLQKVDPDKENIDDLLIKTSVLDAKKCRLYTIMEQAKRVEMEALESIGEIDETYVRLVVDPQEYCAEAGAQRPSQGDLDECLKFLGTASASNMAFRSVMEQDRIAR